MTLEKAEIKRLTAQEIGLKIEKKKQAAEKDIFRLEGAITTLMIATKNLDAIIHYWKRLLDADPPECSMEEAQAAIKAVDQCKMSLVSLQDKQKATKIAKHGEISGIDSSLDVAEKLFEDEGRKFAAVTEAINPNWKPELPKGGKPRPEFRATGVRPKESIAATRRAEEPKNAKKKSKTAKKPRKKRPTKQAGNGVKAAVAFSGVAPKTVNRD